MSLKTEKTKKLYSLFSRSKIIYEVKILMIIISKLGHLDGQASFVVIETFIKCKN